MLIRVREDTPPVIPSVVKAPILYSFFRKGLELSFIIFFTPVSLPRRLRRL